MRQFTAFVLAALTTSAAYAQAPRDRSTDSQEQGREATATGSHSKMMHHAGVDREAAIGHALGMAIEGSSLWHCAQAVEAKEKMANADRKAGNEKGMRDPAKVLEQHARDAFRGSEQLFKAVMQDEKADKNSQDSTQTAKHQACEDFYRAARDYSRALETSCSKTRQAGAQASTASMSESCVEKIAEFALINHAVKEAVKGVALQQMLRHHGEHDRTTAALESHAEMMVASSKHAIDSIEKETAKDGQGSNNRLRNRNNEQAANNGTTRRDAARPNYDDERAHSDVKAGETITISQLAHLGREVIRSVDRLNTGAEHGKMNAEQGKQNAGQDQNAGQTQQNQGGRRNRRAE